MSHGCESDVVPFAARCLCQGDDNNTDICMMISPETWVEEYGTDEQVEQMENGTCTISDVRGWKLEEIGSTRGQDGLLYGTKFRKDHNVVYVHNESQYNHVGHYELSLSADDEGSIQAFINDFNDIIQNAWAKKIKKNSPMQQWG